MITRQLTPQDYLKAITNRKWLVIASIVLSLAVAWVVCLVLPKSYKSTTLMLVEEQKVLNVEGIDSGTKGGGSDRAEAMQRRANTMRQILLSRTLLTQAAHEFHLYGYDREHASPVHEDGVVGAMRGSIKIEVTKDQSFLTLSYFNESPTVARDVTARLAALFLKEISRNKEEIAETSTEFLQQELDRLKAQLEAREKAIAAFKQEHLGELPEQMDSNLRVLDRLESEQTSQHEMARSLSLRMASLDKSIREYEAQGGDGSDGNPRRMRDLRLARIKELERQLLGLMAIYKESYPDIVQIREEIKKLKAISTEDYVGQLPDIDDTVIRKKGKGKIIDSYHADLLRQREDLIEQSELIKVKLARITADIRRYQSRVERAPIHKQRLAALERDYENLHKNYQTLSEKKVNAGIAGAVERGKKGAQFRVIDPANLPVLPDSPKVLMIMFGGLAIGCGLGFGGAVGLELLRRGFYSAEEVEVTLGLPVLVTIPQYESALGGPVKSAGAFSKRPQSTPLLQSGKTGRLLPHYARSETGKSEIPNGNGHAKGHAVVSSRLSPGLELVTMWRPRSLVAEQFRVAATRLELMGSERKSTVIVLTSALMGEGKSCTALNLCHVLARDLDKKTVLVDCDLKRPMQHVYAGVESHPGLTEVLHGDKPLEECLQQPEGLGFSILPAGSVGDGPPALSKMQQVADLLMELRERFDYILVDAPPILPLADMNVLANMADVVALVIRAGTTGRDAVQKALKTLGDPGPVSIILNGLAVQDTPYYMQQMYYQESHHEQLK